MPIHPHDDDLNETLKQFRTELIETRNLTIKTDNLIKNLSADVRQIGKRQELGEKRWVFNSVVAYILFSVLIFAGLYLAFQAQVSRERDAVVAHQVRIGDLQTRVAELEAELERRREAEEEAYSLYRLIEEEKEDEILERFPTLRGKLVNRAETEMMQREVDRINKKLARTAFETGVERHTRRDFNGARDAFLKSILHVEKSFYAPELEYKLGMSLFFLKDLDGAVEHLRKALAFSQKKAVRNETLYHLAVALDHLGRGAEARAAYAAYVKRYATDKRSLDAQKRIMHFTREGVDADGGLVIGP
jgi:TolA-binding protein